MSAVSETLEALAQHGPHPLVQVAWLDSAQPSPGWAYLTDAPRLEAVACMSVGWLVDHSEHVLMLAPNIGDLNSDDIQGSGFIRIPICSIQALDRLQVRP